MTPENIKSQRRLINSLKLSNQTSAWMWSSALDEVEFRQAECKKWHSLCGGQKHELEKQGKQLEFVHKCLQEEHEKNRLINVDNTRLLNLVCSYKEGVRLKDAPSKYKVSQRRVIND